MKTRLAHLLLICWLLFGQALHQARAATFEYDVLAVDHKNLVAKLYLPKTATKVPVVIAFGGAEGGLHTGNAQGQLLAPHGMAVLALAYFKEANLPATLDQIPLEYFLSALDYVQSVPAIDGKKIGVLGGSRGAEAAALMAIIDVRVRSVALTTPSNVAWFGRSRAKSAWTYQGKDIAALSMALDTKAPLTERFLAALQDREALQKAHFAFEKINGPILLISAEQDEIWPSYWMSKEIVSYLQARQFQHALEHYSYPTGHGFSQATAVTIKQQLIAHFLRTLPRSLP